MKCPFCDNNFKTKQHLRNHLIRKRKCKIGYLPEIYENAVCKLDSLKNQRNVKLLLTSLNNNEEVNNPIQIKIDGVVCPDCQSCFKNNKSLSFHSKYICKKNIQLEKNEEVLINCIDEMKDEIKVLKDELIGFKTIVANKPTLNYINNGTTINHQQNIQNFQINDWGKEDISFLNHNDIIEDGPWQTVPRLFKKIHFNPAFLKNYNCRIPPGFVKTKLMEIRKDGKWVKCVRFSELAEKEQYLRNLIIDYAEENKDKIPQKKLERILEYRDIMENRDTNSKEYRELISRLEIIAMNDFISLEEGLNALLDENLDLLENVN